MPPAVRPSHQLGSDLDTVNDNAQALASSSPTAALQDAVIAALFAHYIDVLAPWYDLNDPTRTFTFAVPETALQTPILFKAIIAFSACHQHKLNKAHGGLATAFHSACVTELLDSMEISTTRPWGSELAATCLLRSYELISGL